MNLAKSTDELLDEICRIVYEKLYGTGALGLYPYLHALSAELTVRKVQHETSQKCLDKHKEKYFQVTLAGIIGNSCTQHLKLTVTANFAGSCSKLQITVMFSNIKGKSHLEQVEVTEKIIKNYTYQPAFLIVNYRILQMKGTKTSRQLQSTLTFRNL